MNDFAKKLRELKAASGLSQTKIAAKTGISVAMISMYLSGKSLPSSEYAARLAGLFGVEISELYTFVEQARVGDDDSAELSVEAAAKLMGVGAMYLRCALQRDRFPFGNAVKMPSGQWRYYINRRRFERYMDAADMITPV